MGRHTELVPDLVFDVGLHRGEDTALYLAKGYRVVAFEAHPDHIAWCRARFAAEIADRRLRIVEGAITDELAGTVSFYIHASNSEWGTTEPSWVARNAAQGDSREIAVPAVDFPAILAEAGVPMFMKVDIEGADLECIRALADVEARPYFLSLECDKTSSRAAAAEVAMLESLGYARFALVQQATLAGKVIQTHTVEGHPIRHTLERTTSGDFGDDVRGWASPASVKRKLRAIRVAHQLFGDAGVARRTQTGHRTVAKLSGYMPFAVPGWWDLHGALRHDLRR